MSETKNVVIQQNNGTDYNILYPDSNSWKKDQVAVLETFQKYGLDANAEPKDLFDYLIKQIKTEYGKTYWWKKWKWNLNINRDEPDPNGSVYTNIPDGSTVYFAQFDSVQVIRDGTYIGTPVQIFQKTRKDYFQFPPRYYYSSLFKTRQEAENAPPVCYSGYNTEGDVDTPIGTIWYQGSNLILQNFVLLSDRTTKIDESMVSSTNSDAYPDSDLPNTDGYFYKLEAVVDSPVLGQVYSSFYTGTGTYGKDNPNIITFTGKPQLIFIQYDDYNSQFLNPAGAWAMVGNNKTNLAVTWGDNQVFWYSLNGSQMQGNDYGNIYRFVVIQTI